MKLLGPSRSPYAFKVMVMLAEKGITCKFSDSSPSSPEVTVANPLSKVPTLIRDDGKALYDSSVIVEYLDGIVDSPKLIPENFEERVEVKRWEALGNGVMDASVAISHENREPEATRKGPDFYAKQQKKIDLGLAVMEKDLGDQRFCHGDRFSLADISCGCALICIDIRVPDMGWRESFPALARYAERITKRTAFEVK
jgi:glutathione S-transferase